LKEDLVCLRNILDEIVFLLKDMVLLQILDSRTLTKWIITGWVTTRKCGSV
jgi:hypothetical protein